MRGKSFVDSNVLIYAYDTEAGTRREIAMTLLQELWDDRQGALSMQVLQEFYVNVTRKIPKPLSKPAARSVVASYLPWCGPESPDKLAAAFGIEDQARLRFWDALIVASALACGATRILSEDLNPGPLVPGITIENPFAGRARR